MIDDSINGLDAAHRHSRGSQELSIPLPGDLEDRVVRSLRREGLIVPPPVPGWIRFAKDEGTDAAFENDLVSFGFDEVITDQGVMEIGLIYENSSAALHGLQMGDKILEINNTDVTTIEGRAWWFSQNPTVGDIVSFVIENSSGDQLTIDLQAEKLL